MSEVDTTKSVFTSFEASALLQVNVTTLKNWVAEGRLEAWRTPGGHMRFDKDELSQFAAAHGFPDPFSNSAQEEESPNEGQLPTALLEAEGAASHGEDEACEMILDALETGELSAPELTEITGISRPQVNHLVVSLLSSSELVVSRHKPIVRYSLSDSLQAVLDALALGDTLSAPEIQEITNIDRFAVDDVLTSLLDAKRIITVQESPVERFWLIGHRSSALGEAAKETDASEAADKITAPGEPSASHPKQQNPMTEPSATESPTTNEKTDESNLEPTEVAAWCRQQISRSGGLFSVRLADLVNRRGIFYAKKRLRSKAVREVAAHLFASGIHMSPDYRGIKSSPGINAVVVLNLAEETSEPALASISDALSVRDGTYLEAYMTLGVALAESDGHVPESEVLEIRRGAEARVSETLTADERQQLRQSVDRLRDSSLDIDAVVERLLEALELDERHRLLEELFDVAMADGVFHDREEDFLRQLHQKLGTDVKHFEERVRMCRMIANEQPGGPSVHATLGPSSAQAPNNQHREISYLFSLLTGQQ